MSEHYELVVGLEVHARHSQQGLWQRPQRLWLSPEHERERGDNGPSWNLPVANKKVVDAIRIGLATIAVLHPDALCP